MSFALPSIKVKPEPPHSVALNPTNYGVHAVMTHGFQSAETIEAAHPLISSERNYRKNHNNMNMAMLRNIQGLHAPLRIGMELRAAKQVGRLPFLSSSNAMFDSLTGKDLEVGPEDVLNTPEFREIAGEPHAMVEKSLGIL